MRRFIVGSENTHKTSRLETKTAREKEAIWKIVVAVASVTSLCLCLHRSRSFVDQSRCQSAHSDQRCVWDELIVRGCPWILATALQHGRVSSLRDCFDAANRNDERNLNSYAPMFSDRTIFTHEREHHQLCMLPNRWWCFIVVCHSRQRNPSVPLVIDMD